MNTREAFTLARNLMNEHGLHSWGFEFDNAKRRFGVCRYRSKMIGLSKPLTEANDYTEVVDTILHEIAHALVGPGHGHDDTWKRMCVKIGARPVRCYTTDDVVEVAAKYKAVCGGCGEVFTRHKRVPRGRKSACVCQNHIKDWNKKKVLVYEVVR